jgi:predicted Zn-dependent protease
MEQNVLQSLVERAAQYHAAVKAGVIVSNDETEKEITRLIDEEIKNEKGSDEAAFRRRIEAEHKGGEPEYRETLRKKYDPELVVRSLMLKKLEDSVKEANKVTEDDYKKSVTRLQLKQIVLHPKTPGPEDKDFKAAAEKYAKEAMAEAEKLVAGLKGKTGPALVQAFIDLAKKESDDTLTKKQGGEVGSKLPSELPIHTTLQTALAKADGNLIGPLQDEVSQHAYIFLVQNRKVDLPKDYAKNKAKLLKDFETQSDNEVWTKRQEEIRKSAVPEIYDNALLAYKMQTELISSAPEAERDGLRRDAIAQYEDAIPNAAPIEKAAIRYQMSQLFRDLKQPEKVIEVLQAAVKEEPNTVQLRLDLARTLRESKKTKEAIAQLKEASKTLDENPSSPSPFGGGNPDDAMRQQIAAEFAAAGDAKLAEAERKKIPPAAPSPMGGMGGFGGMGGNPIQINPGR